MPVKLKPSVKKIDRQTKKVTIEHTYARSQSEEELFEMLNHQYTKPKVKQKIRNELVRRGIKIVRVPKSDV